MKKEILIPVLLLMLGFVFIIINIIVYVSKGNSWLIGKKLKVGALMLSLTGIFSCGSPPKPTCYELPPSKEYIDSMANVRKQDSIKEAEKQKLIDDSIANVNKQREKDSLTKIKHKKKPPTIIHPCYMPPKKTCYAPVKINKDL
jgi:hypothetical protein